MTLTDNDKIRLFDRIGLKKIAHHHLLAVLEWRNLKGVAEELKTSATQVKYWMAKGLPGPDILVGRRRFWSQQATRQAVAWWQGRGRFRYSSKLKPDEIKRIRALAEKHTQWELGDMFGVTQSTVSRLLRGRKDSRRDAHEKAPSVRAGS